MAVNEYACRELGYEESELLKLTVPDIVTEPVEPESAYVAMVRSGVSSGTAVLLTKAGWEVPIRYTAGQCTMAPGVAPVFLSVGERIDPLSHRAV